MIVSDFFQLEDLHTLRYRVKKPGTDALLFLSRDFRVQFRLDGALVNYTVPAGTWTDFASIPQPFQGMISKLGPHIEAAVVHDHLCQQRGPWSSQVAADVFNAGMIAAAVPLLDRTLMYNAVALFGPHWGAAAPRSLARV